MFVVLNPYLFTSFDAWWSDLRDQAEVARDQPKPGQDSGGFSYYLDSLTWGLGWAAAIARWLGAVIELRRNLVRGLMLVAVPLALFVYLSVQSRYFGRWLLPAYPALAMLAAAAVGQAAELIGDSWRRRPAWAGVAAAGGLTVLLLAQPLAADVRSAQVLGRDDTRQQARDWLEAHYPPELRASIEPAVPGRWFRSNPEGTPPAWLKRCPQQAGLDRAGLVLHGRRRRTRVRAVQARPRRAAGRRRARLRVPGGARPGRDRRLPAVRLLPGRDGRHGPRPRAPDRRQGRPRLLRPARARVEGRARPSARTTTGAKPVPFNFDLSFNYYPPEYNRPGPTVQIRRLDDCRQATGPPIVRIPRAREPAPFGT